MQPGVAQKAGEGLRSWWTWGATSCRSCVVYVSHMKSACVVWQPAPPWGVVPGGVATASYVMHGSGYAHAPAPVPPAPRIHCVFNFRLDCVALGPTAHNPTDARFAEAMSHHRHRPAACCLVPPQAELGMRPLGQLELPA